MLKIKNNGKNAKINIRSTETGDIVNGEYGKSILGAGIDKSHQPKLGFWNIIKTVLKWFILWK